MWDRAGKMKSLSSKVSPSSLRAAVPQVATGGRERGVMFGLTVGGRGEEDV